MNIKKFAKQLKKINQLFDTIKEDGNVSAIERDLMLSYIRGLYEKVTIPQTEEPTESSTSNSIKAKEVKQPKKVEESISHSNHIADVVMQEVAEATQNVSIIPTVPHSKPATSVPVHQEVLVQEVVEIQKPQIPQELLDLFKFETINELSDKLSRSPIENLTKSMGINEKIFTVKELFGGDKSLFDSAMESMDKFSSFEQARDYLVEHVALDQKWHIEGKVKKAANFIKLVSRRY